MLRTLWYFKFYTHHDAVFVGRCEFSNSGETDVQTCGRTGCNLHHAKWDEVKEAGFPLYRVAHLNLLDHREFYIKSNNSSVAKKDSEDRDRRNVLRLWPNFWNFLHFWLTSELSWYSTACSTMIAWEKHTRPQLRQEPWIARHHNDVDEVVPSQYHHDSATGPPAHNDRCLPLGCKPIDGSLHYLIL